MKKILLSIFVALLATLLSWSCTQDYTETISVVDDATLQPTKECRAITEDEAYGAVERFLEQIDPQTRGFKRTVPRGKMFTLRRSHVNRAISRGSQEDTPLLGFVNLGNDSDSFTRSDSSNIWNGNGYAVINFVPQRRDTILIVTDNGSIQEEDVIIDDNAELPDSLRDQFAALYCEEDDDYYIGNNENMSITNFTTIVAWNYVHLRNDFMGDGEIFIDDSGDYDSGDENVPLADTLSFLAPMLKTHWHQYAPYNKYFPTFWDDLEVKHRVAGCIPIAAAQILAYLKEVSLSEHFGITTSSWIEMEKDFEEDFETHETDSMHGNNLALIIKQIAIGINAQYNFLNSGGTFATPKQLQKYLKSIGCETNIHFGYGNDVEQRIIQSLNNNYPVFIGALSSRLDGHSWVIDGYSRLSKYSHYHTHCNMGWENGSCNGWYYYGMFNTYNNKFQKDNISDNGTFAFTWWFRTLFFD